MTEGKWQSVPHGWTTDREGTGDESAEFEARDVKAQGVRGRAKRAGRSVGMK